MPLKFPIGESTDAGEVSNVPDDIRFGNEGDEGHPLTASLDTLERALRRAHGGELRALREAQGTLALIRQQAGDLLRRQKELRSLYVVVSELASILDLDRLLGSILDQALALMEAERGFIVLARQRDDGFDVALVRGMDPSELARTDRSTISRKLVRHVLQTRKPLVTTDAQHDERFANSSSIIAFQIRSVLAVPLMYQQELIGAIYLDTRMTLRVFGTEDLNLLSAMASQAAVAIYVARLYRHLEDKNIELAQMLKELREAQDELVRRERLSAIGAMASRVVHDLKGHMTVIKAVSQMLGDAELSPEQRTQFAEIVDRQVDAFVGMTQEILDFAKGEQSLQVMPFDACQFLQDLYQFLAPEFSRLQIEIDLRLEYHGTIVGDRQKLWRAMYNIAKNASEAMSGNGKTGGRLQIAMRKFASHLELALTDSGGGLPPQMEDCLFEPFATTGKTHGTGLGLAIAKSIVDAHGGEIDVDSVPGHGCTFTIKLPAE